MYEQVSPMCEQVMPVCAEGKVFFFKSEKSYRPFNIICTKKFVLVVF